MTLWEYKLFPLTARFVEQNSHFLMLLLVLLPSVFSDCHFFFAKSNLPNGPHIRLVIFFWKDPPTRIERSSYSPTFQSARPFPVCSGSKVPEKVALFYHSLAGLPFGGGDAKIRDFLRPSRIPSFYPFSIFSISNDFFLLMAFLPAGASSCASHIPRYEILFFVAVSPPWPLYPRWFDAFPQQDPFSQQGPPLHVATVSLFPSTSPLDSPSFRKCSRTAALLFGRGICSPPFLSDSFGSSKSRSPAWRMCFPESPLRWSLF